MDETPLSPTLSPTPSTGRMIPGERERNTLTHRQPGSIGAPASGADVVGGTRSDLMDAATVAERQREGGGAPRTRNATRDPA